MLQLKSPKEMECGLDIGYEICQTQSRLFLYAIRHDYDDTDFVKKYMTSNFCNDRMDSDYSRFQLENAAYIMSYLLDEIDPINNNKHYDEDAIEWAGWMYRYVQLRFELPSREIYEKIPLDQMIVYYYSMRTQDAEYFIEHLQRKWG